MAENNQLQDDILVNLKALNNKTETNMRLLPRTKAEAVIETDNQQFISRELKESIYNKQDKIGYTPVNKAGDKMAGPLYLQQSFTEDNQAVSKAYVDQKIKDLINSSPEALDTLYELARAIGNDPNFATTVTNLISTKLNSNEVVSLKEPNKILRLDRDGDYNVDIKGNAASATKLKNPFRITVHGDYVSTINSYSDGSQNLDFNIQIPLVSVANNGLMTSDDYQKLYSLKNEIKQDIGARAVYFTANDFVYNALDDYYRYSYDYSEMTSRVAGNVQVFQKDPTDNSYYQVNTDIRLIDSRIIVTSINNFDGKMVFNISI